MNDSVSDTDLVGVRAARWVRILDRLLTDGFRVLDLL